MVGDGAFIHKVDYVTNFKQILNLEGHLNRLTGSRVTAILLNVWILPIGRASVVEGLLSMGPTPYSFYLKVCNMFVYIGSNYTDFGQKNAASLEYEINLLYISQCH